MALFTICYATVLILELARFFSQNKESLIVIWTLSVLGLVHQTSFLSQQIFFQHGHIFDSIRGWMLTVSWCGVLLYLHFLFHRPRTPFGLFLLPLVLISIMLGVHFADTTPFPHESIGFWWRMIHGVSFIFATIASFAGFITGIMYYLQISRLKQKRSLTGMWKLPSMEWLQKNNSRAISFLLFSLGLGILSGLAINRMSAVSKPMIMIADPMIIMTAALFVFLGAQLFLTKPRHEGKRVALLTIICFLFLSTILLVGLFSENAHWRNLQKDSEPQKVGGKP